MRMARRLATLTLGIVGAGGLVVPSEPGLAADDPVARPEMGVDLVADLRPGPASGDPGKVVEVGGRAFFLAQTGPAGEAELHAHDPRSGESTRLEVPAPGAPVAAGDRAFLSGAATSGGRALWITDGTPEGTQELRAVQPFTRLMAVGGRIYFGASEPGGADRELWTSDGTASGTHRVADIRAGEASSSPVPLAAVGDELWFAANDGMHGEELWRTDGTEAGTRLVVDLRPGEAPDGQPLSAAPRDLVTVGDAVYFVAYEDVRGLALWQTDRAGAAPRPVVPDDRVSQRSDIRPIAVGGRVVFGLRPSTGQPVALWAADPSDGSVGEIAPAVPATATSSPAFLGGVLHYLSEDASGRTELWRTDGTAAGTRRAGDLVAASPGGTSRLVRPEQLTAARGRLFFTAADAVHGWSLWSYAPGEARPVIAETMDHSYAPRSSTPSLHQLIGNLAAVGDELYLGVGDLEHGFELWSTSAPSATAPRVTYDVAPSIEGTPGVGRTLTAVSGSWTPGTATLSHQWLLDDQPIPGATATTLRLDASTADHRVRLRVTAAAPGHRTRSATTQALEVHQDVVNLTPPSIVGTARVGSTLTARVGSWAPDGLRYSYSYEWFAGTDLIPGEQGRSLLLSASTVARRISVRVRAYAFDGRWAVARSSATVPVERAVFRIVRRPSISGTARVGSTLRVWTGSATPSAGMVEIRWLRAGRRPQTGGSRYLIRREDAGHRIVVEVRRYRSGWRTSVVTVQSARVASGR